MTVYRYKALPYGSSDRARLRIGELAGSSPAEVRAALHRLQLQVLELRPLRWTVLPTTDWPGLRALREALYRHLRRRRRAARSEIYDSLATMLESGLPLLEGVSTICGRHDQARSVRSMLLDVRSRLREGEALADAATVHPDWFGAMEIAMISAAQHSGTLPEVLRRLAGRQERLVALTHKLTNALAYPAIVALVGVGVVIFLSVKTLPNLVGILAQSKIEPPGLTVAVMSIGQFLASWWLVIVLLAMIAAAGWNVVGPRLAQHPRLGRILRRAQLRVVRRLAVARVITQLAELLSTGIPIVEALRVLAPVSGGGEVGSLAAVLRQAADRVERGEDLEQALGDGTYFDSECRRLIHLGETTGELDVLLDRLGLRYERQAQRQIEQLTALLEPAVILTLAALIGTVVMAAILPLLRLQQIL